MNKLAGLLLAAMQLFLCFPAHAQVYKWVDAKGVTHYGEKPPENTKSREVTLRGGAGAPAAAPAPDAKAKDPAWKDQERAFKQRQLERSQAESKKAEELAKLEANCKKARANLADLRTAGRVTTTNEKGEREFLGDREREKAIAERQEEYNQHCS